MKFFSHIITPLRLLSKRGEAPLLVSLWLAVELVPQSAIHECLTTEYLFIVSVAVIRFVALSAKELLKVLWLKLIGGLPR
jgi:hypothetical protein